MRQESRIFQAIPLSSDRDQILREIAMARVEVFIRFDKSKTLTAKAQNWTSPFKLQVSFPEGPRPLLQDKVLIQITFGDNKYFSEAYIQETSSQIFLIMQGPLYKVQRRHSFRLKLPATYPASAQIFEVNGHNFQEKAKVLDISEGGCSLSCSSQLKDAMGAYLGLKFKIGNRGEFIVHGHIRYLGLKKNDLRIGIQFDPRKSSNSGLFSLTRDLYVELFSKWSRRR